MTDQSDPYAPPPPGSTPSPSPYATPQTPPPLYGEAPPPEWGRPQLAVPYELLASPWRRLGGALLSGLLFIVTLGIGYLIWAIITWQDSTTPAKKMLGMRVVDARTGAPLTFGGMVMRQVVWYLVIAVGSFFTGGILGLVDACFAFTASRQRLLDRMAKTLVVRVP